MEIYGFCCTDTPFHNLWCMRFVDGDWVEEARLISGADMKDHESMYSRMPQETSGHSG